MSVQISSCWSHFGLVLSVLLAAGCDANHSTEISIGLKGSKETLTAGDLVIESRWFPDADTVPEAMTPEGVRALSPHQPTADWPLHKKPVPGVPVAGAETLLQYSYAVAWVGGEFRPVEGTWLAVWKAPREEWCPQEFVVVKGEGGVEVRRLVRSGDASSLGRVVGAPVARSNENSSRRTWEVALPLEAWVKRAR